eukprot:m.176266 g.176266  ORF g.176266 m.176266 type:complete len:272 (+) comp10428_c2_seq1:267-1082(+)
MSEANANVALAEERRRTRELQGEVSMLRHHLEAEIANSRALEADKRQLRQALVALRLHAAPVADAARAETPPVITLEDAAGLNLDALQLQEDKHALEIRLQKSCPQAAHEAQTHLVRELSEEVVRLRHLLSLHLPTENRKAEEYLEENDKLREEVLRLKRQLEYAQDKIATLERGNVSQAFEQEVDDERMFNLQRSATSSRASSPMPISSPIRGLMATHGPMMASSPPQWSHLKSPDLRRSLGNHSSTSSVSHRARASSDASTTSSSSHRG